MTGETPNNQKNDHDTEQPLSREDLISLHSPTTPPSDDLDHQLSKEHYQQQLGDILNTPLKPENFASYADDALDGVIKMVEGMTTTYPGVSLPLPRSKAEDYTVGYYEMSIDALLDSLQAKVNETRQIEDFVSGIRQKSGVFVPPQDQGPIPEPGSGEYTPKETAFKLETILFLLQERYGLDFRDPSQIKTTKGAVDKQMMRQEPYFLVDIPSLGRKILVCNEVGNITYVLDSNMPGKSGIDDETLVDMDKSQINELIEHNFELGVRIMHTSKYIPKIEEALESIEGFTAKGEKGIDDDTGIKEESLLTEAVAKAPEGYKNVRQIAEDAHVGGKTIREIVDGLGLDLGDVIRARFGNARTYAYSPEQIAMILQVAQERGLLLDEAPEGYKNAHQIANDANVNNHTIKEIINGLGLDPNDVMWARFGNVRTNAYSPEQIAMILQVAQERGLFFDKAPEGYKSVTQIAEDAHVRIKTIRKIVDGLGFNPDDVIMARFGNVRTNAYSPEQISMILQVAQERGLFFDMAPEGYKNVRQIAEDAHVGGKTIREIVDGLGLDLGDVIRARFGTNRTNAYSPEQIAMILQVAQERGLLLDEAPEGYKNVTQIAEDAHVRIKTIKEIINGLGLDLGDVIWARFRNGRTNAYSPEQIDKILKNL